MENIPFCSENHNFVMTLIVMSISNTVFTDNLYSFVNIYHIHKSSIVDELLSFKRQKLVGTNDIGTTAMPILVTIN